jgi:hypothetical protein
MTLRRAGADGEADYDATAAATAAAAAAAAAAGEQHSDRLELSGVPPIALVVEESHIKVFRCCCCLLSNLTVCFRAALVF